MTAPISIARSEFLHKILSIHTRRAEIYTLLLNETQYINDYGIDQLDSYCKEAILEFQQLSKSIRTLEAQWNHQLQQEEQENDISTTAVSYISRVDTIIPSIQTLEQSKLKLVVLYMKQQIDFFRQSCPHNHQNTASSVHTTGGNNDQWKQSIFDQYKDETLDDILSQNRPIDIDNKNIDDSNTAIEADVTAVADGVDSSTSMASPESEVAVPVATIKEATTEKQEKNQNNKQDTHVVPPCAHKHADYDHDEFQRQLQDAKKRARIHFITELSQVDDEINEIFEELRAELIDLVD